MDGDPIAEFLAQRLRHPGNRLEHMDAPGQAAQEQAVGALMPAYVHGVPARPGQLRQQGQFGFAEPAKIKTFQPQNQRTRQHRQESALGISY